MNQKHLFNLALLCRLASLLCLALFFYSYFVDLAIRTQMLAIALSFTGWICGSFFLGLFNTTQTVMLEVATEKALENVKDVTDDEETTSHPLFKDETNE